MVERYTYTYDNWGRPLTVTHALSNRGSVPTGNFTYDANGNMTADSEAGLTGMTYNVLNLLSGYNAANNRQVVLTYSASGEKLSEQEKVSGLIESEKKYFGNLVYEGLALYPNRLLIDGGYVDITTTNNSSNYTYRYYVQDHLGNNRLVTDDSGTILQTNHYDPYGQLLSDISSSTPVSQYKYGNKEWDTATASYDFGARRYTPSIPRWTAIDPLAEKYYAISPYVYCAGNPVNLVDLEGKKWATPRLISILEQELNKRIESLENGDIEADEVAEYLVYLRQAQADIKTLEEDDNYYVLSYNWDDEHYVQLGRGGLVIIETSSDAISLHEIHHVAQSLAAGGLLFTSENYLKNAALNQVNQLSTEELYEAIAQQEIESYRIQYSMDKSFPGTGVKSLNDINVFSVGDIKRRDGNPLYKPIWQLAIHKKIRQGLPL